MGKPRKKSKGAGRAPAQSYRAVVIYLAREFEGKTAGYHLDTLVQGSEESAEIEAEAARSSIQGALYGAVFVAPVTYGTKLLDEAFSSAGAKNKKKKYSFNVWLLRREVHMMREYEVRFGQKDVMPGQAPAEWQSICIEREWSLEEGRARAAP